MNTSPDRRVRVPVHRDMATPVLIIFGWLAAMLAGALGASLALAQTSDATPSWRFGAGSTAAAFSQSSSNSQLGTSDSSSSVKLQGSTALVGVTLFGVDSEFRYQSLKAKADEWYHSRSDLSVAFGKRFDFAPWVVPSVGLYQLTQKSDRSAANAPVAFIDHTMMLSLGIRAEGMPIDFGGHGLLVEGRFAYLTSGEAKSNFGTTGQVGVGYGYKSGTLEFGALVGAGQSFVHASNAAAMTVRDVRSVMQSNSLTLYVEY